MALRVFADRDGCEWNAWLVQPGSSGSSLHERFREGWVCFEKVGGGGRCRLPLDDLPPSWESLPDDRLDLLRRVADESTTTRMPRREVAESERDAHESSARARTADASHATRPRNTP